MTDADRLLAGLLAGTLAPPQALAALAMWAPTPEAARAALGRAVPADVREADRLAAMRAAAADHPSRHRDDPCGACGRAARRGRRVARRELARVTAGFDAAAAISAETAAALHSLGDAAQLREATREIVEHLQGRGLIGPGTRVLDVGCGAGRLALALAPLVARVHGIDPSAGMIAAARAAAAGAVNVGFSQTAGHELGCPGGAFDLAIALDSFPYVVQAGGDLPARTFAAVARSLAAGGHLVVLNLSYRSDADLDRADAVAWAGPAGLRLEAIESGAFARWDGAVFTFRRET